MEQFENLTDSKTAQQDDNLSQIQDIKINNSFKRKKTIFTRENILRGFIIVAIIAISTTLLILYVKCFTTEEHKQHLIWIWNFVATSNTLTGFFAGLSCAKFISWLLNKK